MLLSCTAALIMLASCSSYPPVFQETGQLTESLTREGNLLILRPSEAAETALIFYPGGLVSPEAYIPAAWEIGAAAEAAVIIVPMPFDLAVFAPKRGLKAMEQFPEFTRWFIAGHSLGGAMAASLVHDLEKSGEKPFSGLILLGSYPAGGKPLTDSSVPVMSIYAEFDGLASPQEIEESRALLPPGTEFVLLPGGSHAQFGSYGAQKGDGIPLITAEEQQRQTAAAAAAFMKEHR
jgi:hypothetical protein